MFHEQLQDISNATWQIREEGFFNRISRNEIRTGSRSRSTREKDYFSSFRVAVAMLDPCSGILCSFNPAVIRDIDRTRFENCSY